MLGVEERGVKGWKIREYWRWWAPCATICLTFHFFVVPLFDEISTKFSPTSHQFVQQDKKSFHSRFFCQCLAKTSTLIKIGPQGSKL